MRFEEFADAQQRGLLRTAFVLTGDRQLAEDLVQTVLTSVWLRWSRIGSLEQRDAYVRKMLLTQYVSWRRRRWWNEAPTAEILDETGAATLPDIDLARALRNLPRRQRAVVVLAVPARPDGDGDGEDTGLQRGNGEEPVSEGARRAAALGRVVDRGVNRG